MLPFDSTFSFKADWNNKQSAGWVKSQKATGGARKRWELQTKIK